VAALQNTKDYWEYESWFIWISGNGGSVHITETIEVEYKNEALTAYAPELVADAKPPLRPPKP
jgi:hypothetical protein